jgi:LytS/YehU family sensor histidine kinase
MLTSRIPFVLTTYTTIWLYKQLFLKKNYFVYTAIGFTGWSVLLGLIVTFQKFYLKSMPEIAETEWMDIFLNQIPNYLVFFIVVTMFKYFKDNFINQYYEDQRKQLQVKTELQNLKAQISPHFLFNTMNNFYGLAVEQSKKLPELMVRLSNLLRYSLYETNSPTVPIVKEIEYLKNYIELEKIRLEETINFEFSSEINEASKIEIAPLLLFVFVENAFKHAKNVKDDHTRIKINVSIVNGTILLFEVRNNCLMSATEIDYNKSGIGLENVRKRLEVLYPNGLHDLTIKKKDGYFDVKLKIKLVSKE